MFESFDNLDKNYIPDNTTPKVPNITWKVTTDNLVKTCKDISWNWHETVSIPISVNRDIYVEDDAIVSYVEGEYPSEETEGKIGQKFYNAIDITSYTCMYTIKYADYTEYAWEKDSVLTYSSDNHRKITLTPSMIGKTLVAKLLNFRCEELYSFEFEEANEAIVEITPEISDKLLPGIYYFYVYVNSEDYTSMINHFEIHVRSH